MTDSSGAWPHVTTYQTRWLDNDQYGHLNNSAYYLVADSVINAFLIEKCGIQPFIHPTDPAPASASSTDEKQSRDVVGLVISNSCRYFASCSFPAPLRVGLRVVKLGTSSVTYQVSISEHGQHGQHGEQGEQGAQQAAALITSTHVFVDRITRRPATMPKQLRAPLEGLLVKIAEEEKAKL
ncbi:related to thioesterase [Moesziomyces antarcticus]|uniref:Related to thioesterase n=2 Tax=Pseudozyma antarctica TaxID=84753 RepID=A0A5C3FD28_PSEA2|nr:related to thioesterase [Moesziomyces antarcticus]